MIHKKASGFDDIPTPQVILIEDDPSLRFALCQTLRRYGFVTIDFSEPQVFFEWLQTVGPCKACLLLDMRLPTMSGLEVQAKLDTLGRQLPIIFMSGNSHISEAITGLKKGAIDFLLKPFDETALVAAINKSRQQFDRSSSTNRFHLTPRELLVLEHVANGLRSEQIANLLGLSVRTIKMHRSNILHKTGANTMTEAVVIARQTPISA
jgi:FixJ family two-component response regulator